MPSAGSASALTGGRLRLFAALGNASFGAAATLGMAALGTVAAILFDALSNPLASGMMAAVLAGGRLRRITVFLEASGGHSAGTVGTTLTSICAVFFDAGLKEGAASCGAALLADRRLGLFATRLKASLISGLG